MWHRIISKLPIPVDVPLNTRPSLLSGDELQRLVIKAIRLEDNWQRDRTRVRGFKALINDNKVNMSIRCNSCQAGSGFGPRNVYVSAGHGTRL